MQAKKNNFYKENISRNVQNLYFKNKTLLRGIKELKNDFEWKDSIL